MTTRGADATPASPERIAAPLLPLAVPIDSVHEDPANARIHPPRNIEAIKASLVRFGQRIPIVVQKQDMIVRAGNARLRVARDLGWKRIAAVIVDESSIDAVAFAIADNRTVELAEWDDEALAKLLDEIRNAQGATISLEDVGYSAEKLDEILERLAKSAAGPDDPREEWDGMPEFEQEDDTPWKVLKIYFKCADAMREFAKLVGQTITDRTTCVWFPKEERARAAGKQYVDGS